MHDWTKDWYTVRYALRRGWKWLLLVVFGLLLTPFVAWSAAALENPAPGALKSGVGVVSGWVCDATRLEVSFDGGARLFVPYGSERTDTAGVCGDADNGFGLLWNYNELSDGPHTVTLYIDGQVQTQTSFNVVTLGTNFLRGVTGQGTVMLSDGKQVNVQWEETTQGFTITGYSGGDALQPPSSGEGVGQFTGTWTFTARNRTTRTYTFGNPEPCWVDLSNSGLQCVQDYLELATLGPATMTGYNSPYTYALIHQLDNACLSFFFNEPANGEALGDYGADQGSCLDPAVVTSIAQQVYSGNYPVTGMRTGGGASGQVCTSKNGLTVEDIDDDPGRWNVTNRCTPQHGYPNVLYIDITPLSTEGYFIDIDDIAVRQGGRVWQYDYGDTGTALWANRDTGTSIDYTVLPYRLSEAPYRTMLLLGADTGLDLSQPFLLYYDNDLVARFE